MDDIDLMTDQPGDPLPLPAPGEPRTVVALLGYLEHSAKPPDAAVWAKELQGRLLRRIPAP